MTQDRPDSTNPAAFGLHISKAAGSSLLSSFRKIFPENRIYQTTSFLENFRMNKPEFYELSNFDDVKVFWGHHLHEEMIRFAFGSPTRNRQTPRPFLLFTGLREPFDRTISELAFNIGLNRDFNIKNFDPHAFLRNVGDRMCDAIITRFPTLCGPEGEPWERAARALHFFDFVYDASSLQDCLKGICALMGVTQTTLERSNASEANDTRAAEALAKEFEHELRARLANDILLFEYAQKTFSKTPVCSTINDAKWRHTIEHLGVSRDRFWVSRFLSYNQHLEFRHVGKDEAFEASLIRKSENLNYCIANIRDLRATAAGLSAPDAKHSVVLKSAHNTKNDDHDVLLLFSHLFYPHKRPAALKSLVANGLLPANAVKRIEELLAEGRYSYRAMFRSIGQMKVDLDEFTLTHVHNKLRPLEAVETIKKYMTSRPNLFSHANLAGRTVLDFGSGIFSPLKVGILLYVNGAGDVTSFEPAGWRPRFVRNSIATLISEIHLNPEAFNVSGISDCELRRRLADLRFPGPEGYAQQVIDLGPVRCVSNFDFTAHVEEFDLILSTSVFEHVQNFGDEIRNHLSALKRGGCSINRIDFTDHRHASPNHYPFGFYYDGHSAGCNLLRVSDLQAAAEAMAATYEISDVVMAKPEDLDESRLRPEFSRYSMPSLLTKHATFTLCKQM